MTPSFTLETAAFRVEVYRLLAAVYASRGFAREQVEPEMGARWEWLKRREEEEISRLLLLIAVMARNGLDANPSFRYSADTLTRPVGRLQQDVHAPESETDLTFREACNKVIHTTKYGPIREIQDAGALWSLTGSVDLYGTLRSKPWKARLDVPEFAFAALNAV